ncbi:hypothetical protein GIB67_022231 [Kingdonia uniflora]|uniref:cellulase n=1 Tax=Kingdonia uniflora TaxID=39325 RepID=A0A7J7M6W0_9MAGN|nr:hypothetical protein GIB67_022231 [Kingdonia uniflora]
MGRRIRLLMQNLAKNADSSRPDFPLQQDHEVRAEIDSHQNKVTEKEGARADCSESTKPVMESYASKVKEGVVAATSTWMRSYYSESEKEQNKHPIAVPATIADAAVVIAQAAVAVVRLTSHSRGTMFNGGRKRVCVTNPHLVFFLGKKSDESFKVISEVARRYSPTGSDPLIFYNSTSYWDEYLWGGAWMYYATGNSSYLALVTTPGLAKYAGAFWRGPDFGVLSWDNKLTGAQELLTDIAAEICLSQIHELVEQPNTKFQVLLGQCHRHRALAASGAASIPINVTMPKVEFGRDTILKDFPKKELDAEGDLEFQNLFPGYRVWGCLKEGEEISRMFTERDTDDNVGKVRVKGGLDEVRFPEVDAFSVSYMPAELGPYVVTGFKDTFPDPGVGRPGEGQHNGVFGYNLLSGCSFWTLAIWLRMLRREVRLAFNSSLFQAESSFLRGSRIAWTNRFSVEDDGSVVRADDREVVQGGVREAGAPLCGAEGSIKMLFNDLSTFPLVRPGKRDARAAEINQYGVKKKIVKRIGSCRVKIDFTEFLILIRYTIKGTVGEGAKPVYRITVRRFMRGDKQVAGFSDDLSLLDVRSLYRDEGDQGLVCEQVNQNSNKAVAKRFRITFFKVVFDVLSNFVPYHFKSINIVHATSVHEICIGHLSVSIVEYSEHTPKRKKLNVMNLSRYTMKEKVPPTASNKRKRELDRADPEYLNFEDLVTYKKKNVETTTVVSRNTVKQCPPNTIEQSPLNIVQTTNDGVSKHGGAHVEDGDEIVLGRIMSVVLGIIVKARAANNDEVGPIDTSFLRSFKFHRARKNLLLDLKGFKALKESGAGNSLLLKKLREYYAYKLEKVLSDGTAMRDKMKGLTARPLARAYMLYVLGSFLFPMKNGTDVSAGDKRDSAHGFKEITYFYGALRCPSFGSQKSRDDDIGMSGIHQKNKACINEDGDTPVDYYEAGGEQYHASLNDHATLSPNAHDTIPTRDESYRLDQQIKALNDELQKLKEDKDQESNANINLPEALKEKILNWTSKYKKKVVRVTQQTNNLRKKLANAEEMKKSLEVNNNEWEIWRQSLKKALTSEGIGDMEDPTFEELFDQNERFTTITQQGPKGDYQEDLVS